MSIEVPEGWQVRPLGELVEFLDHMRVPVKEADREKRRGPYPYYGANGQIDWIDGYIFEEPLVLLAEDGGFFGSKEHPIAYKIEGKTWVNNHAHVLRPLSKLIDIDYLHWFLSFRDIKPFLSGSTRAKLTKTDASRIPLIFPKSLDLQRRIAGVMQRVNKLKSRREQANQLTSKFIQSVFLKMFGDETSKNNIGDVAEFVSSGSTPLGGEKTYVADGIVFIRSQNVLMNELKLDDVAHISKQTHNQMRRTWAKDGDVLLNITGASMGRVAIYRGPNDKANVNQHVCLIRLDQQKALPEYVSYYLSSPNAQKQIWTIQAGASRQALNFDQVRSLSLYLPHFSEQHKFAAVVKKTQALRDRQAQSTKQISELFQSLMHKAFRGELGA